MSDVGKALRQLEATNRDFAERHERFKKESAERGNEIDRKLENLKRLIDDGERRVRINKQTHHIRFADEMESAVTIVIEKKGVEE